MEKKLKYIGLAILLIILFISGAESAQEKFIKRKKPYLLMVTSLDEKISSTPLLDVKSETVELLNESPFDGVALNLVDIYSGQAVPNEEIVINKAKELKNISKKDIWVRVNINRIYQRSEKDLYYQDGWEEENLSNLPMRGLPVGTIRRISTAYFNKIKGMDIYDEKGALSDFYKIWDLSLKFSKIMNTGIILDSEHYSGGKVGYKVSALALMQGKSTDEVIKRLKEIGAHLVNRAAEEYPSVTVISLFTLLDRRSYEKGHFSIPAYICQGMLMEAKERRVPLKLVEGGEADINYINKTQGLLKRKIEQRRFRYHNWLESFPNNFYLGATITIWDDTSKIGGWVKREVGESPAFKSLEDFRPFLRELFSNYEYIWIYVPMVIDYDPFDPTVAPRFNQKLKILLTKVLEEVSAWKVKP